MSINLASSLSAITTDSSGVNHIVWVENNVIWHAVYDSNAGTWVDAQQILSDVPDNITSLNLVANQNLIQVSKGGTAPGLAVVWQQGDVTQNGVSNSNFFYSAATYNSSANLQWLETPQQLTVNENSNAKNFANLKPQAIADNNGNVFVVGQQVNLSQGQIKLFEKTQISITPNLPSIALIFPQYLQEIFWPLPTPRLWWLMA